MKNAKIKPMVNQVEMHPANQKKELVEYFSKNNIQLIAWSPIMRGKIFENEFMITL